MTKRTYSYLFFTFLFFMLTAFQCEGEDLCKTTTAYTTEKIPIKVEKPRNPKVNDTIWVSILINENLKDINGNNITLKIDAIEELNHHFQTSLKNNFNEFNELNFGVFYVKKEGSINTYRGGLNSSFVFDNNLKAYIYDFGLILKEKGTYKIEPSTLYFNDFSSEDCPDFFYEIPVFFENKSEENGQVYTLTVD